MASECVFDGVLSSFTYSLFRSLSTDKDNRILVRRQAFTKYRRTFKIQWQPPPTPINQLTMAKAIQTTKTIGKTAAKC